MASRVLIVPGTGNSSAAHWQSMWQGDDPGAFMRIALPQDEWDSPTCDRWLAAIADGVNALGADTVLLAHSLGCLAVARWAAASEVRVRGAFMVAPPDPLGPAFPASAASFAPAPLRRLPCPSIVAASSNDRYASIAYARRCALTWGSRLYEAGAKGHLSDGDGLGAWPEGRALLEELRHGP